MSRTEQSISGQEVADRLEEDEKAYQDAEVLRFLYHNASMSMQQIGSRFDVTRQTIKYWMQNHDIERRQMEEGFRIRQLQEMELGEEDVPQIGDF